MAYTIKMPSAADIDKAYKDGAKRAPARYKEKVVKVTDFKERAIAGQDLYEAKMTDPTVLARRKVKLEDMPPDEWKNKASTLGAERIGRGMIENAEKRTRNYESVRSGLDGLTLPDKTPDVDTNIDQRLKTVVHAERRAAGKE